MKKLWKRATALLLAGAMCLGLAGCGDKSDESSGSYTTLAQELGYGYVSEYTELGSMELDYVNNVSTAMGTMYVSGSYYDEEGFVDTAKLYAWDPESGSFTKVATPELYDDDYTHEYIYSMSVSPDGESYWVVLNRYTYYWEDEDWEEEESSGTAVAVVEAEAVAVTEDAAVKKITEEDTIEEDTTEEDTAGSEIENGDWYYLRQYDMSGSLLQEIDLSELSEENGYFYCDSMAQDGDGNIYLAMDDMIFCYGADGVRKEDVAVDGDYQWLWIESMAATESGTVLACVYRSSEDGSGETIMKLENGTLTDMNVEGMSRYNSVTISTGSGDTALVNDGTYLYSMDAATGELTKLLSWLDSDISGSSVQGVVADGEDTIMVFLSDFSRVDYSYTYELGTLTKTPAEELPERTVLTLGAVYLDDTVEDAIIAFNRKNDTYRITLVDYSSYNTDDNYSAGADQLDKDIISGACPDILCLGDTDGSVRKYISKGVLADLTPLIEADPDFSMDDLLSGPLQSFQSDGKLYGMPYYFALQTLLASTRLVGDMDSWTYQDMAEIADALDEDVIILNWYIQTELLTVLVQYNMDEFVDYASATCNFETEDFETILSLCAKLPEDYDYYEQDDDDDGVYYYVDEYQQVQSGEALATSEYIWSYDNVQSLYNIYNADNGFVAIGYPTSSGTGAVLNVYGSLGVSAKSANQEGAWEFIKTMLDDSVQLDMWDLPVTVSAMDQVLAKAMEQPSYTDPDTGETVYYDSTYWIGETEYTMDVLTEAQAEAFKELVNGASTMGTYDEDLMTIITEEAAAYFAGDKTAAEVASLIQSRATIYLGETS